MALYQSLTSSSTPEQIAAAYKEAIASAGGDTAANQKIATDYLTSLGISAPTITAAYNQYLSPTGSMGALPQTSASADPIEQLYQQYAGRAADPGGLDYWRNQFGSEVDPNETGIFQRAVAEAVAKGIESTTTATNYNPYFTANPDVAAAYLQNTYGLTPEQFAQTHYQNYGQNEGRAVPTSLAQDYSFQMPSGFNPAGGGLPAITSFNPPELTGDYAKAATDAAAPTLKYYTGKTYQGDQVLNLAKQLATIADPSQIKGGVFGEKKPSVGFDYSEAQKILGGEPTVYEQVLLDSAANLIDQGITDLSQLKPSTYTDPETGEVIPQNSLFAGQTYSGPGVTNYRIQFDASGKPKFTTTGVDTGDKGLIAPLAIGASLLGVPAWLGSTLAPGAAAATQAAIGGAAFGGGISALTGQNVLKGALLGGLGGYASSTLGQALKAGITDVSALQAAADADMAAGMLPEFGTNAAYDTAMANLMAGSPGAVSQLQNIVDSQVGGTLGPDNIDVGGGWNPAGVEATVGSTYGPDNIDVGGGWNPAASTPPDLSTLPQADYSNEGRNYPTPGSTQGSGGSPINASMAGTGLAGLGTAAKLAALAAGAKGVQSLLTPQGSYGMGSVGDGFNPLGGYKFSPGAFQASVPDPAMFRPTQGVVTVADAIRQAQANQQGVQAMAEGGSTKPKYTGKAALSAMSPWERAAAQLNNAAYFARMPVGIAAPQNAIGQLGQFAAGGGISDLGGYSDGGRMLKGAGDGMSDSIPATIGGKRPARLADGEFVVPADVVSGLGNGSTDAGAKQLYQMMDRVRQARTGTKKQGKEINAPKHMPA